MGAVFSSVTTALWWGRENEWEEKDTQFIRFLIRFDHFSLGPVDFIRFAWPVAFPVASACPSRLIRPESFQWEGVFSEIGDEIELHRQLRCSCRPKMTDGRVIGWPVFPPLVWLLFVVFSLRFSAVFPHFRLRMERSSRSHSSSRSRWEDGDDDVAE